MTVMARTTVGSLRAGDEAILTEGGEPFVILAAGEPVGEVRQLDVARPGTADLPVRVTLALGHPVVAAG